MRLGFDAAGMNERGMCVNLHDTAVGAQEILGHDVCVFYDADSSNPNVVKKFSKNLRLVPYSGQADLLRVSEKEKLDFCYRTNAGSNDGVGVNANRVGIHAVFRHFEPHGDVYAYISEWLADWMSGGAAPHVPYIVQLPEPTGDLRSRLNIPADAFVVGRYGGYDQFNIEFAQKGIAEALAKRSNLHFIFVNTQPFIEHERVHYLPTIVAPQEKSNFIATCDAGINAKKIGESFGLATAEFLLLGRPVFSWAGGMDQNHVVMTPKRQWLYTTKSSLVRLLGEYESNAIDAELAKLAVAKFSPDAVMKTFDKVFLQGDIRAQDLSLAPGFELKRSIQQKLLRAKFRFWKLT
ncbi:hypothetical protein [Roseibium sp.]|uniref:hypothetical protein n=1 Tax=Roseibium sp. TaxID=1936156 RepID=UPI003A986AE2